MPNADEPRLRAFALRQHRQEHPRGGHAGDHGERVRDRARARRRARRRQCRPAAPAGTAAGSCATRTAARTRSRSTARPASRTRRRWRATRTACDPVRRRRPAQRRKARRRPGLPDAGVDRSRRRSRFGSRALAAGAISANTGAAATIPSGNGGAQKDEPRIVADRLGLPVRRAPGRPLGRAPPGRGPVRRPVAPPARAPADAGSPR